MSQSYADSPLKLRWRSAGASSLQLPAGPAEGDTLPPLERHTPPPAMHAPDADQYCTPAHAARQLGSGASWQVPPLRFDTSPDLKQGYQANRLVDTSVPKHGGHGPVAALPQKSSPQHVLIGMPAVPQPAMTYPVTTPYPSQPFRPSPQVYSSYTHSTPVPHMPIPNFQPPPAANFTSRPAVAGQTPPSAFF